jgi:hypothetical protein
VNYDDPDCAATDLAPPDPVASTASGTSFATPHVTALAAVLWALDDELPAPLTHSQVRAVLTDARNTVPVPPGPPPGTAPGGPQIDAFAAVMALDRLRGRDTILRALVDVDDGTLDGNQREQRDDSGAPIGVHAGVETPDGRRGDGRISMADFRAFRDAAVQVAVEDMLPLGSAPSLDGPTTHWKKDLNLDACVFDPALVPARAAPVAPAGEFPPPGGPMACQAAPRENVHPRYDWNGDGRLDVQAAPFPGPLAGAPATDLDVLRQVWPADDADATEGYGPADLAALLPFGGEPGSGDIEFRTRLALGGEDPIDEVRLTVGGLAIERRLRADRPRLVWTLPAGTALDVQAEGRRHLTGGGEEKVEDLCLSLPTPLAPLMLGEDRVLVVSRCISEPPSPWFRGGRRFFALESPGVTGNVPPCGGCTTFYDHSTSPVPDPAIFPTVTCPPLDVGEACSYDFPFPGAYSAGTAHAQVTRVATWQWQLQIAIAAGATAAPAPSCDPQTEACSTVTRTDASLVIVVPVDVATSTDWQVSCSGTGSYAILGVNASSYDYGSDFFVRLGGVPLADLGPCRGVESPYGQPLGFTVVGGSAMGSAPAGVNYVQLGLRALGGAFADSIPNPPGDPGYEHMHTASGSIMADVTLAPMSPAAAGPAP